MPLQVLDHPLAGDLMRRLRDKATPPAEFRQLCQLVTTLLVLEGTKHLPTLKTEVDTPLALAPATRLGKPLAAVPILRAGLGMLEAVVHLFPDVSVGYVGLERDHETAVAHSYYCKLPKLSDKFTLCLDPMLATGGSASHAMSLIKDAGATESVMLCVVAAPEGVERMLKDHSDCLIVAAALDEKLDERKYIVPGLGDFGDRLYGTG